MLYNYFTSPGKMTGRPLSNEQYSLKSHVAARKLIFKKLKKKKNHSI